MTQISDSLRTGDAYYARATATTAGNSTDVNSSPSAQTLGAIRSHLYVRDFGTPAVGSLTNIASTLSLATAVAGKNLTCTGTYGSGAAFDAPRGIQLAASASATGVTFTITGKDEYGETVTAKITGQTATTAQNTLKAFAKFTSVNMAGRVLATTVRVKIGTTNLLGLPYRLANKGRLVVYSVDGVAQATPNVVAGLTTTQVSTATTGDTRGTVTSTTLPPNGSRRHTVLMYIDESAADTKKGLYGVDQA